MVLTVHTPLLDSFIRRKIAEYSEPSRLGTPKGEPVGLSKKKYLATLYMLSSEKRITLAKELRISYGLLRKWNTEEPFKSMVQRHCDEFVDIFFRNIIDLDNQLTDANRKRGELPYSDFLTTPSPKIDFGVSEIRHYDPDLANAIFSKLSDHINQLLAQGSSQTAVLFFFAYVFSVAVEYMGEKMLKEIMEKSGLDLNILTKIMKATILQDVINIIQQEEITETDRKKAHVLLTGLQKII